MTATPFNWLYMFLSGGIRGGLYTRALILVGERFRGADLAAATTAFTAVWGVGGIAGPPMGGFALTQWDPHGVPATIALIFLLYLPFPLVDWLRRRCAIP